MRGKRVHYAGYGAKKKTPKTPWARAVVDARLARGLTQEEAAELIGVAYRTLVNWEAGRTPSKPLMHLLKRVFPEAKFPEIE